MRQFRVSQNLKPYTKVLGDALRAFLAIVERAHSSSIDVTAPLEFFSFSTAILQSCAPRILLHMQKPSHRQPLI